MEYKFITTHHIRLAYLERNPNSEKVIFFIHGNSVSSATWKAQLDSTLFKPYRLIAIDLPAHGESGPSSQPLMDYNIPRLGEIMASAINTLAENDPFMLVALSMGTSILAEALAYNIYPKGIALVGSCIVGGRYTLDKIVKPNTNVHVVFTEQSPENEVREYANQVMKSNDYIDEFISDYYQVKSLFRSSLMISIQEQMYSDQIMLIERSRKPILLIFGKDEQIVNPHYLDEASLRLWQNKIFKIPAAGHLTQLDQPEAVNQLLIDYATEQLSP